MVGEFLYAGLMIGVIMTIGVVVGVVMYGIDYLIERKKYKKYIAIKSEVNHEIADEYMEKFNKCYDEIIMKEIWED